MSVTRIISFGLLAGFISVTAASPQAVAQQQQLEGQVLGAGSPIADAMVTLFAATSSAPTQLSQTQTGADGRFRLSYARPQNSDTSFYLVATGGVPDANKGSGNNPSIALLTVVGTTPATKVVINEMTTVASVWTHAQFLDGTTIKGNALGLKIAGGNVPNFVDLQTGGWGTTIQDPLNGSQTPTMANFATLADLLSGCATRVLVVPHG